MRTLTGVTEELTELRASLSSPDAAVVGLLLTRICDWREDDSSVEELVGDLAQVLKETRFSTHECHAQAALAVARLRDTVDAIGGMAMNERLVLFDLHDRWDRSKDDQRGTLYDKLLARR